MRLEKQAPSSRPAFESVTYSNTPRRAIWQRLSDFQTRVPNGPAVSRLGIYPTDVFHLAEGHV